VDTWVRCIAGSWRNVLDSSGNPVGEAVTIEVATLGLRASRRDGRVREDEHL
jgi:hypothetical protein